KRGVAVRRLEVLGDVARDRKPIAGEPCLVCTNRRPKPPDLVGQLARDALAARKAGAWPVAVLEQAVQQGGGVLSQRRPLASNRRVEIRDRKRRIPCGVDAPVYVRSCFLGASGGIQRVVVLVCVLAAAVQTCGRIAQDAVEVGGRQVQVFAPSRER